MRAFESFSSGSLLQFCDFCVERGGNFVSEHALNTYGGYVVIAPLILSAALDAGEL